MSEEGFDDMIEEAVWKTVDAFNVAMATGDYNKANELLEVLYLPIAREKEKNKSLEDIMVA